jgi:gas vesicle protein
MTIMNDRILTRLGLQTRRTPFDFILPALGVLGAGMAIGAGLAVLLAPMSGRETRAGLRRGAGWIKERVSLGNGEPSPGLEELSRDELYEKAREQDIVGRSSMTKEELSRALQAS